MRSKASVREEYISLIGYDPFADDPSATVSDVARRLEDYKHLVAMYGDDDKEYRQTRESVDCDADVGFY